MKADGLPARVLLVAAASLSAVALVFVLDRALGAVLPASWLSPGLLFPPNVRLTMRTSEFSCEIVTNELGLRGPPLPPRRPGRARIAVLGDSSTYGWGVDIEDAWPSRLQAELRGLGRDVDVVNLGSPGADPVVYANVAERAVPLLEPDLVVVAVLQGDDVMQLPMASSPPPAEPPLRRRVAAAARAAFPTLRALYANAAGRSRRSADREVLWTELHRSFRDGAAQVLASLNVWQRATYDGLDREGRDMFESGNLNPRLLSISLRFPRYYLGPLDEPAGIAAVRQRALAGAFARIRRVADAHGARVLVLGVPFSYYVSEAAQQRLGRLGFATDARALSSPAPDRIVAEAAARAGIPHFAPTALFRREAPGRRLFFEWDNHFTAEGNGLFASAVAAAVDDAVSAD